MKIWFMGTPFFAVPSLEKLHRDGHVICGVFTQPDKPKNRGMKLAASPVKEYCITHEIPVFTPGHIKEPQVLREMEARKPDLTVVVAYGKILPPAVLACPALGSINVHASLLPKYRGAAPIQWAMLNGEKETGVTIQHMAPELDAGDMIAKAATPIDPEESLAQLWDRLSILGAALLGKTVQTISDGTADRVPQDHKQASYAPMLTREMSPILWQRTGWEIYNQVRGLLPWPTATMQLGGKRFKVFRVMTTKERADGLPGTVLGVTARGLELICGDGEILAVTELQADGGKRMRATDYFRGHPLG